MFQPKSFVILFKFFCLGLFLLQSGNCIYKYIYQETVTLSQEVPQGDHEMPTICLGDPGLILGIHLYLYILFIWCTSYSWQQFFNKFNYSKSYTKGIQKWSLETKQKWIRTWALWSFRGQVIWPFTEDFYEKNIKLK